MSPWSDLPWDVDEELENEAPSDGGGGRFPNVELPTWDGVLFKKGNSAPREKGIRRLKGGSGASWDHGLCSP